VTFVDSLAIHAEFMWNILQKFARDAEILTKFTGTTFYVHHVGTYM